MGEWLLRAGLICTGSGSRVNDQLYDYVVEIKVKHNHRKETSGRGDLIGPS